jgi:hypothetical protein
MIIVGVGSAAPALAQTTITVTVTGGGTFTAHASPATFALTSATLTCANSTASVTISNQVTTGTEPLAIGTAANFAFVSCTGPRGATTLTPVPPTTYQVAANSTTSNGVTKLTVSTLQFKVSMQNCTFLISGIAPASYNNTSHAMGMGPIPPPPGPLAAVGLTASKATAGCKGVVSDGQAVTFTATYALTPSTQTAAKTTLHIVSRKG